MSHSKIKTTYCSEGAYGVTETNTLYCDHNNTSDFVTFYDESGYRLFTVCDTIDNNLMEAIIRLYGSHDPKNNPHNIPIEYMNEDDRKKCSL